MFQFCIFFKCPRKSNIVLFARIVCVFIWPSRRTVPSPTQHRRCIFAHLVDSFVVQGICHGNSHIEIGSSHKFIVATMNTSLMVFRVVIFRMLWLNCFLFSRSKHCSSCVLTNSYRNWVTKTSLNETATLFTSHYSVRTPKTFKFYFFSPYRALLLSKESKTVGWRWSLQPGLTTVSANGPMSTTPTPLQFVAMFVINIFRQKNGRNTQLACVNPSVGFKKMLSSLCSL